MPRLKERKTYNSPERIYTDHFVTSRYKHECITWQVLPGALRFLRQKYPRLDMELAKYGDTYILAEDVSYLRQQGLLKKIEELEAESRLRFA